MLDKIIPIINSINKIKIISEVSTSQELYDIMLFDINKIRDNGFFVLNSCFYRTMLMIDILKKEDIEIDLIIDLHIPLRNGYQRKPTVHFALKDKENVVQFIGDSFGGAYHFSNIYHFAENKKILIKKIEIPIKDLSNNTNIANLLKKFLPKEIFFNQSPKEFVKDRSEDLFYVSKKIDLKRLSKNLPQFYFNNKNIYIPENLIDKCGLYVRESLENHLDFLLNKIELEDGIKKSETIFILEFWKNNYINLYNLEYK